MERRQNDAFMSTFLTCPYHYTLYYIFSPAAMPHYVLFSFSATNQHIPFDTVHLFIRQLQRTNSRYLESANQISLFQAFVCIQATDIAQYRFVVGQGSPVYSILLDGMDRIQNI